VTKGPAAHGTRAGEGFEAPPPPSWIAESQLLSGAYLMAAAAHASQRRATDRAPFLDHVVEVAMLLEEAGCDDELVAAGLLHDAVERGTLTEGPLRREFGETITALVLALTEDSAIESFPERKAALREQVSAAGERAVTIFAADKLSDIRGLGRGIDRFGDTIEARMGTTVEGMAGHYRESVEMIEASLPGSGFVAALHEELAELDREGLHRRLSQTGSR
jgi:(p)ppGpp synthase/HD superfamily hydrolase